MLGARVKPSSTDTGQTGSVPTVAGEKVHVISPDDSADSPVDPKTGSPGVFSRATRICVRFLTRAGVGVARLFGRWFPPQKRRRRAAYTATACVVVCVGSVLAHRYATTTAPKTATVIISAPASRTSATTPPPTDIILKPAESQDQCPRDQNYSDSAHAFDGDLDTAWRSTRIKNKDHQHVLVTFDHQVALTDICVVPGFDSVTGGVDHWTQNRLVTKLKIYFPTELGRAAQVITTGAARDYRCLPKPLDPPAVLSQLLLVVLETVDPPTGTGADAQAPGIEPHQTTTSAPAGPDGQPLSTVAISNIRFTGHLT